MNPTPNASRRQFIQTTTAAMAAFTIVPRHVLGGTRFVAPSDKVNVAVIGAGGMGMVYKGEDVSLSRTVAIKRMRDELKLDRAFIRAMGTDPRAAAIVASTAALAHSLDLRVVAEGVETEAEWEAVKEAGCDDAQGYLRGRPMPASEVERLVAAGPVVEVPVAPVRLTPPA